MKSHFLGAAISRQLQDWCAFCLTRSRANAAKATDAKQIEEFVFSQMITGILSSQAILRSAFRSSTDMNLVVWRSDHTVSFRLMSGDKLDGKLNNKGWLRSSLHTISYSELTILSGRSTPALLSLLFDRLTMLLYIRLKPPLCS